MPRRKRERKPSYELTPRQEELLERGILLPPDPGSYKESSFDRRLLGTWKSDRRRTLQEIPSKPGEPASRRRKLRDLFGHLRLRYTRTRIYSSFKGTKDVSRYEVIGVDSDSIAIMTWIRWRAERIIYHIRFAGKDFYRIDQGSYHEWFQRIGR